MKGCIDYYYQDNNLWAKFKTAGGGGVGKTAMWSGVKEGFSECENHKKTLSIYTRKPRTTLICQESVAKVITK